MPKLSQLYASNIILYDNAYENNCIYVTIIKNQFSHDTKMKLNWTGLYFIKWYCENLSWSKPIKQMVILIFSCFKLSLKENNKTLLCVILISIILV